MQNFGVLRIQCFSWSLILFSNRFSQNLHFCCTVPHLLKSEPIFLNGKVASQLFICESTQITTAPAPNLAYSKRWFRLPITNTGLSLKKKNPSSLAFQGSKSDLLLNNIADSEHSKHTLKNKAILPGRQRGTKMVKKAAVTQQMPSRIPFQLFQTLVISQSPI